MTQSIKDQLLKLGFDAPPPAAKAKRGPGKPGRGGKPKPRPGRSSEARPARTREEIDLGRAWALRQQAEKAERLAAEQERQEQARQRREAREKLASLLQGRTLNREDAEQPRHFEYGGKIRRVYVSAEQFAALNRGELGVVQQKGRYLLVDAALALQAAEILPASLALLVDPNAAEGGDEYADPRYRVPDDLTW